MQSQLDSYFNIFQPHSIDSSWFVKVLHSSIFHFTWWVNYFFNFIHITRNLIIFSYAIHTYYGEFRNSRTMFLMCINFSCQRMIAPFFTISFVYFWFINKMRFLNRPWIFIPIYFTCYAFWSAFWFTVMIINTSLRDISVAFFIYSRCLKTYISFAICLQLRVGKMRRSKWDTRGNLIFFATTETAVQQRHSSPPHSFRTTAFVVVAAASKRASYMQIETRSASLH